jgi:hypothetical protein
VQDVSDFSAAFPHGGTELGEVQSSAVVVSYGEVPIVAEEFGTVVETFYTGERWVFSCALRTWDDDALAALFPHTATGSSSGKVLVKHDPDTYRAGQLGTSREIAIAFVADNPLSHPSLYFRRCVPLLEPTARLALQLRTEHVIPAMFMAIPPTSGNTVEYGLLEDFTV